jgi:hypothetical protein
VTRAICTQVIFKAIGPNDTAKGVSVGKKEEEREGKI